MFTVALFTIAKIWKQPNHPSVDEWGVGGSYDTFIQRNTTQLQKKGNLTFCNSMDGPGDYYAK